LHVSAGARLTELGFEARWALSSVSASDHSWPTERCWSENLSQTAVGSGFAAGRAPLSRAQHRRRVCDDMHVMVGMVRRCL